ncbi:uncharacterized protein METZ01_LOCUS316446 [marine metagenome]|uniref:Cyclodeaminase/cyclohydrolase domain-containing protein n=1 Tax=marine metagenome TaxID=408172 RepID=A0A382NV49_9ZZZZ|tara:strand:+ start:28 stop:255 length:228 start_codon:yes stop_codon:yes gene_type:complete
MSGVDVGEALLLALELKYEGDIAIGRANIEVYMDNSAGIGEHPDIVNAVDSQIEKVAEASEKLDVVRELLSTREE